jgi:hypothetical protein
VKRKYYSILCVLIVLIFLAAVAVRFYMDLGKKGHARPIVPLKQVITVEVPDSQTIGEMERLETVMNELVQQVEAERFSVDLKLFGYQPVRKGNYMASEKNILLQPDMNYSLTLAFSAGTKRFCVIDGKFYQEGMSLPDGGRILTIEPNRVRIKKHRFTNWIPVGKQEGSRDNNERQSGEKM